MSFCQPQDDDKPSVFGRGGWNATEQEMRSDAIPRPESRKCAWSFRSPRPPQDDKQSVSKDTDACIADALQQMSLQARDKAYHDIHGVEEVIEETPAFLEESFAALQFELDLLLAAHDQNPHKSSRKKPNCDAFLKAQAIGSNYVHSPFHYKAFLRAERFDAKAAAIRMVKFFDMKAWCFGPLNDDDRYLCQDITQRMLTTADLESYRKGADQILPWRDRSGRGLVLDLPPLIQYDSPESMGRIYMYIGVSLAQDEDTQRRGAVLVAFEPGFDTWPPFDMALVHVAVSGMTTFPVRYASFHQCFSDRSFRFIAEMAMKLQPVDFRARNKLHFGTPMECLYSLLGFGIPLDALPLNLQGELKLKPHLDWLEMRAAQEQMIREGTLRPLSQISFLQHGNSNHQSQSCVVVIPSLMDILLGRGTTIGSHEGNIKLREIVDEAVPEYEAATRRSGGKFVISLRILKKVQALGGRFLKQDPVTQVWSGTDDETARLKICRLFNDRRAMVLAHLAKRRRQAQDTSNEHERESKLSSREAELEPVPKRGKVVDECYY